jgi:hypothetical protein
MTQIRYTQKRRAGGHMLEVRGRSGKIAALRENVKRVQGGRIAPLPDKRDNLPRRIPGDESFNNR